jgi:hypothetical protein
MFRLNLLILFCPLLSLTFAMFGLPSPLFPRKRFFWFLTRSKHLNSLNILFVFIYELVYIQMLLFIIKNSVA